MKREKRFLQEMKLKGGILFVNMRVNFAHTKQWSKGIKNMKSFGWGVIFKNLHLKKSTGLLMPQKKMSLLAD